MPEASQGRRVWDLSYEMIKERRWSFELALRRELVGPPMLRIFVAKMAERKVKESHPSVCVSVWDFSCQFASQTGGWTEKNPLSRPAPRE